MSLKVDLLIAILWSLSPFGEAKVGIPYGLLRGENVYAVFLACFLANTLVFPLMLLFLNKGNHYLIKWHYYKKAAIYVARKAKIGSSTKIDRYGFWGLLFFVMLPIPGTGVYAGTIATYLLKIERPKAFLANVLGAFFSALIVWSTTLLSMKGLS